MSISLSSMGEMITRGERSLKNWQAPDFVTFAKVLQIPEKASALETAWHIPDLAQAAEALARAMGIHITAQRDAEALEVTYDLVEKKEYYSVYRPKAETAALYSWRGGPMPKVADAMSRPVSDIDQFGSIHFLRQGLDEGRCLEALKEILLQENVAGDIVVEERFISFFHEEEFRDGHIAYWAEKFSRDFACTVLGVARFEEQYLMLVVYRQGERIVYASWGKELQVALDRETLGRQMGIDPAKLQIPQTEIEGVMARLQDTLGIFLVDPSPAEAVETFGNGNGIYRN